MRSRVSENESLKTALRGAYVARERAEIGEEWPSKAMKRIRQIGPLRPGAGFWAAFESLVWRLAPVSCALVLLLTYFLVNLGQEIDSDYLGTVAAEMERPSLVELFDIEGSP